MSSAKRVKDDQQLLVSKLHFYQTLTTPEKYKEFKSILLISTKLAPISTPIFAFLENYGSFKDLFTNPNFEPTKGYCHDIINANLEILLPFKSGDNVFDTQQLAIKMRRVVSPEVSHQLLRFYATFIAPGAPLEVFFITLKQKEDISLELLNLITVKLISGDIFDNVARVVLETLFQRCFPQYLKHLGVEYQVLKKLSQQHKEWTKSLKIVPDKISTPVLKKRSIKKFKWLPTRESMVSVLSDPVLYQEFQEYVNKTHCEENLVLFESYSKLEERTRTFTNLTPALIRFLEPSNTIEDLEASKPCPLILAPLFLFFNRMFIIPDSPFQVNVTHTCRKDIEVEFQNTNAQKLFRVGIFDSVVDHVLGLLYQNSFVNLVKLKEASAAGKK